MPRLLIDYVIKIFRGNKSGSVYIVVMSIFDAL